MDLLENIREGLRSVAGNRLRTILTALIIALGITSLVGTLTAIDGIQASLNSNFEGLGANVFNIVARQEVRRFGGRIIQKDEPIDYHEAITFRRRYKYGATISISTLVSGAGQVKYGSKKTNPNVQVVGIDDAYLTVKNYKIGQGRPINSGDIDNALTVAVIGNELANTLFQGKVNPVGQLIRVLGSQFRVVGVLEKKGSLTGGGDDRVVLVPLENARQLAGERKLTFDITASVTEIGDQEMAIGEATGLMRLIRQDRLGQPDSFDIERADALVKDIEETTGYLRWGGFGIGAITLLGAAIALMNIMLVSVTERTREIGIRKSLGATPMRIRQQFLIEAIVICILGGLVGIMLSIAIGNAVAFGISSDGEGRFVLPWLWMMLGLLVCVAVGLFSGIYPAIRASKLDPIDALRYE
ncbi:ABC transporter permease [Fibrella sp. WM1]|uniref:ABC transporter permease n=1 Tax=Fibrella musci TaxID=3242485 RepID=UPI0035221C13